MGGRRWRSNSQFLWIGPGTRIMKFLRKNLGRVWFLIGKVHSLIHMFDVQTGCLCVYKCLSACKLSSKSVTRMTFSENLQFVKHLMGAKKLPGVSSSWTSSWVRSPWFSTYLWLKPITKVPLASPWPPQLVHETSSQSGLGPAPHPPGTWGRKDIPQSSAFLLKALIDLSHSTDSFKYLWKMSPSTVLRRSQFRMAKHKTDVPAYPTSCGESGPQGLFSLSCPGTTPQNPGT